MGFLIVWVVRLLWRVLLLELWLCWALVVLTVVGIASMTGHDRTARKWMHSLNWRHVF